MTQYMLFFSVNLMTTCYSFHYKSIISPENQILPYDIPPQNQSFLQVEYKAVKWYFTN
jgi:hypothetical protein